ncbi:serine hydrolase domain-containing protein [Defluviimonas salinarum]|uniref:Beta-lactamase family protein n=1 Tax=Defluviimonas salinarum TaxID=2992147 RepID=A0ABT3J7I2_9RHOB|nr:serine hydrolase [Defluviimonas salinarum]MCW3783638.1 beta-lactamase family protein [Defluviimonas salinarum]
MSDDLKYATHHELNIMKGYPPPPDKRVRRADSIYGVPGNRWAYQNMRRLFPSANIAPSPNPRKVRVAPDGGIERLSISRADGSAATFDDFLKESFTDAFVVIKDDAIVFERYLNGSHANQPHIMMSVTKSFTGLLGLMAVHEGRVSEDAHPTEYIPQLKGAGAFEHATVQQIFDMTNSMAFDEDYANPDSDIQTYGKVAGFLEAAPGETLVADNVFDYTTTLQKGALEHGEAFAYCTPKTEVVNWIVNNSTGRSYEENMSRLFDAFGAEGETYILLDNNANLIAGGGLNATPHNLARFAMMMLNDGKCAGQQVVPLPVIEALEKGGDQKAFLKGPNAVGMMARGGFSYRAQWWVRTTEDSEWISAIGIHGQWIIIDRKRGMAIIKQSSQPVSLDVDMDDFVMNAADVIRDYLKGK